MTLGQTVMKHSARKIRRLHNGQVLAGFAGSTADAMALFAKFEAKIEEYRGNLERAAVELAKEWRTDRVLRRLEAFLVVADRERVVPALGRGRRDRARRRARWPWAAAAPTPWPPPAPWSATPPWTRPTLALEAMKIAGRASASTRTTQIVVETL